MATVSTKKVTRPVKAQLVPTKAIATAASKVTPVKAQVKAKSQTHAKTPAKAPAAKALKPVPPVKAAPKLANKPVVKKPVKVAAKPLVATINAAPAKEKTKKAKLVRDSFTMPEAEYAVLSHVKKACLSAGIEAKKSQLLRVGLLLLSKTDVTSLKALIANLEPLKAGRPKKDK